MIHTDGRRTIAHRAIDAPRLKRADALVEGDVIAVGFAHYGDLLMRVIGQPAARDGLVDIHAVVDPDVSHTTVAAPGHEFVVYPTYCEGDWR